MINHDFDENRIDEYIKNGVVILDFFAKWCGPCKMLSPELDELVKKNSNITVYKIDVDKNIEIARKYGVMSIPTLVLYKNGLLIDKTLGYRPVSALEEWIKK